MVDETGLERIFSLVTEQFWFVLHHFCECNTDWICIALLFASWATSLLQSIPYQVVQHSLHWNQEVMNHHAFFAITLPCLTLRLQPLLLPFAKKLVWAFVHHPVFQSLHHEN